MNYLPTRNELTQTILVVFNNDRVAKLLSIFNALLLLDEANGSGSQYSYLMRWARTELKQRHKLQNIERRKWMLL